MKLLSSYFFFYSIILILSASAYAQNIPDFTIDNSSGFTSIAVDNNGNMHVVWSKGIDTLMYDAFNSGGQSLFPPKVLATGELLRFPFIKIKDSTAVVVWIDVHPQVEYSTVIGKLININNTNISEQFNLDISYLNSSTSVTFINDTAFAVFWYSGEDGLIGQILSTSVNIIGDLIFAKEADKVENRIGKTNVLFLKNTSDLIIFWSEENPKGDNIYGRLYSPDGIAKDTAFFVNERADSLSMFYFGAAPTDSSFAVAWAEGEGGLWKLYCRWFNNKGTPSGPAEIVSSDSIGGYSSVDISIDNDGKGIITWEKKVNGYYRIYGKRFSSDKEFYGSEFKISSSQITEDQYFVNTIIQNDKIYSVWDEGNAIKGNILNYYSISTDINEDKKGLPKSFKLQQNYPNPFNPSTSINYQLPYEGRVTIKVYNILGNEVATLVNETKAAGEYNIKFDAANLSSGVYIYTIKVNSANGGFTESKKMTVLK